LEGKAMAARQSRSASSQVAAPLPSVQIRHALVPVSGFIIAEQLCP
jgi:hypothetical protein